MEDDVKVASSSADDIRALLASMPGQAMRQLDEWAARVVTCPPMEVPMPTDAYAVERRLAEAAGFARAWQTLRAQTPAHFSAEHALFEAYFEEAGLVGWLYMDQAVYVCNSAGSLRCVGPLGDVLLRLNPEYFAKLPEGVARVAELVHETYVKENRCLRVDCARIQYDNATAMMTAGGVSIVPTPLLALERPIVPRAVIPTTIGISEHATTCWHNGDILDPQLHVFMGALLRPTSIRRDDIRPVLLLATCALDVVHPLIILVREFCGLSVVTALPKEGTATPNGVLLVEAQYYPVTDGRMADIRTALSWGMVVVVHAAAVPPLFLSPLHAYVRLAAVHVPWAATPLANSIADARHHILPATQASYQREGREAAERRRHMSFLCSPELMRFRLPPSGTVDAVVEMLQCGMGLQCRRGKAAAHAEVAAAYAVYAAARGMGAAQVLTVDAAMEAMQLYRELYGHLLDLPTVTYTHDTASFTNVMCVVYSGRQGTGALVTRRTKNTQPAEKCAVGCSAAVPHAQRSHRPTKWKTLCLYCNSPAKLFQSCQVFAVHSAAALPRWVLWASGVPAAAGRPALPSPCTMS
jgi:hypothetical protein